MTIGRPSVEREESSQHTESDEDEGEEDVLDICGNSVIGSNRGQLEGVAATVLAVEEIDTQQSEDQQGRASHQHQRELHG